MRSIRVLSLLVFNVALGGVHRSWRPSDGTSGPAIDAGLVTDLRAAARRRLDGRRQRRSGRVVTLMTAKMGILRSRAFTAAIPVSTVGARNNGTVDAMGNHCPFRWQSPPLRQVGRRCHAGGRHPDHREPRHLGGGVVAGVGNAMAGEVRTSGPARGRIGNSPASVTTTPDTGNDTSPASSTRRVGATTTLAGTVGMAAVDGIDRRRLSNPSMVVANDTSYVWVVDLHHPQSRSPVDGASDHHLPGTCGSGR